MLLTGAAIEEPDLVLIVAPGSLNGFSRSYVTARASL